MNEPANWAQQLISNIKEQNKFFFLHLFFFTVLMQQPYWRKASGGIEPLALASLKACAALSKSQLFCSRHWVEKLRFIPDFWLNDVANDCLVLSSTTVVEVVGCDVTGWVKNAFLLVRSVAWDTNKVSLMMTNPAPLGTTTKHLKLNTLLATLPLVKGKKCYCYTCWSV